jgi:hypothetical protein
MTVISMSHPTHSLWALQHRPAPYPPGMLPIPEPIPGRAFFPGGYGLCAPNAPFPFGKVMIVGQDFDTRVSYEESFDDGEESETGNVTWRNLLAVLDEAQINPADCFYTNYFLGMRKEGKSTGKSPGQKCPAFVAHCGQILLEQVKVQRPRLVLIMGIEVPRFLARMSPELTGWRNAENNDAINATGPLQHAVTFDGIAEFSTTVAVLTHPCHRHLNVRLRSYQGLCGHEAEMALLRDALLRAST